MKIIQELQENADAVDAWIDSIPHNVYDPCPCGCGKKFKYVKDNPELHEMLFKKKFIAILHLNKSKF